MEKEEEEEKHLQDILTAQVGILYKFFLLSFYEQALLQTTWW
jgi:hypothetical protein